MFFKDIIDKYISKDYLETFNEEKLFIKYFGTTNDYNDNLKTLSNKFGNEIVFFDSNIPYLPDFDFISQLKQSKIGNITNELKFSNDTKENEKIITIFNRLYQILKDENGLKIDVYKTFEVIGLMLKWFYDEHYNKNIVVYYGNIKLNEYIFLNILFYLNYDILVLIPTKNKLDFSIEDESVSYISNEFGKNVSLDSRLKSGNEIMNIKSSVLKHEEEISNDLLKSGIVVGDISHKEIDVFNIITNIDEIKNTFLTDVKYRQGYKVLPDKVLIPTFKHAIYGVPENYDEYIELLMNNFFVETYQINNTQGYIISYSTFFNRINEFPDDYMRYIYYYNGVGLNVKDILESDDYNYNYLNNEVQINILNGLNKTIQKIDDKEIIIKIIYLALNLPKFIIQKIETFNLQNQNPKFLLLTLGEEVVDKLTATFLELLNNLAYDVIVFIPNGRKGYINFESETTFVNKDFDLNENNILQYKNKNIENKKNFFGFLFKK